MTYVISYGMYTSIVCLYNQHIIPYYSVAYCLTTVLAWRLVFKAPRATTPPAGYTDILSLYSASGAYNEGNTAAMTDFSASGTIYKSDILNQWESNVTVTAVNVHYIITDYSYICKHF